jgi:hypothetical protein
MHTCVLNHAVPCMSALSAPADPTQATAATAGTALPPQSIDGGFIDSDDEAPAATPAPAAGRAAAAGGRRRVLPASLGR